MKEAQEWQKRCMHEKRMHSASAFLTLTYDDDHLPPHNSLRLYDLQSFMKRLRLVRPQGLRFFGCGEYGEETFRPHYHVLLFNTDFPDMRAARQSGTGEKLYTSGELSGLWKAGSALIGTVTNESCAYVAGYVVKKALERDARADGVLGQPGVMQPEFRVMSRRPGIGNSWFEKYHKEAYAHDSVILNAREVGVPKYYDIKLQSKDCDLARAGLSDHTLLENVKRKRARERVKDRVDNPLEYSKERSMTKERHAILMSQRFKREV